MPARDARIRGGPRAVRGRRRAGRDPGAIHRATDHLHRRGAEHAPDPRDLAGSGAQRRHRQGGGQRMSEQSRVAIATLPTGVPGLDEILGSGLPEYSFNLIVGTPGAGKTTLAHQLMFALATPARPALYFTVLGEPPLKMLRYQQQYAFFDAEQVNRSIRFISLGDDTAAGDLGTVL